MKKGKIKILGTYVSAEKEASIEENWNSEIENMLREIKNWETRNPTLWQNTRCANPSTLTILQVLALPEKTLKHINTIVYRSLWKRKHNNKKAFQKVKRGVLSLEVEEGG